MDKKFQVFISSTYEDLKSERQKIQDIVLSMYQIPIGMEMFSAADEEQWEIIKNHIDNSDFYVLIIAHRYGSVIEEGEDKGISYTEKEYNYAVNKGIPVLAFIIDEKANTTIEKIEKNPESVLKLQNFISKVSSNRVVEWWMNIDDLSTKVMNALSKQIIRNKRPGWVRAPISQTLVVSETVTDSNIEKKDDISLKNIINTHHQADKIMPDTIEYHNSEDLNVKLEYDIYEKYHSVMCPLMAEIEVRNSSFAVEIINEVKSAFTNISRYKLNNSVKDLDRANSHILRGIMDAYKYICSIIMDKYDTLIKKKKKSVFKHSEFPSELLVLSENAKNKLLKAKLLELSEKRENVNNVLKFYEETYYEFCKLDEAINYYTDSIT